MAEQNRPRVTRLRFVVSLFLAVMILSGSAYFFGVRGLRFFLVPSTSMEPTLRPSDYLITMKENTYRRGDICVIKDPKESGSYVVKRIVGLPGDTIAIAGGALFLNGKYASEPYIKEPMEAALSPVTVPEGQYFVLGDNRNDSEDSLSWRRGIPHEDIVGKVRWIYSPLSRFGPVQSYPLTNTDGV